MVLIIYYHLSSTIIICFLVKNGKTLCALFQAKGWWKVCCEKEIPKYALYDILNKKYPTQFVQGRKDCIDWKYVYKRWYQWGQVRHYSVLYHIPALDVFKDWLNVIKTSGKVSFFLFI